MHNYLDAHYGDNCFGLNTHYKAYQNYHNRDVAIFNFFGNSGSYGCCGGGWGAGFGYGCGCGGWGGGFLPFLQTFTAAAVGFLFGAAFSGTTCYWGGGSGSSSSSSSSSTRTSDAEVLAAPSKKTKKTNTTTDNTNGNNGTNGTTRSTTTGNGATDTPIQKANALKNRVDALKIKPDLKQADIDALKADINKLLKELQADPTANAEAIKILNGLLAELDKMSEDLKKKKDTPAPAADAKLAEIIAKPALSAIDVAALIKDFGKLTSKQKTDLAAKLTAELDPKLKKGENSNSYKTSNNYETLLKLELLCKLNENIIVDVEFCKVAKDPWIRGRISDVTQNADGSVTWSVDCGDVKDALIKAKWSFKMAKGGQTMTLNGLPTGGNINNYDIHTDIVYKWNSDNGNFENLTRTPTATMKTTGTNTNGTTTPSKKKAPAAKGPQAEEGTVKFAQYMRTHYEPGDNGYHRDYRIANDILANASDDDLWTLAAIIDGIGQTGLSSKNEAWINSKGLKKEGFYKALKGYGFNNLRA